MSASYDTTRTSTNIVHTDRTTKIFYPCANDYTYPMRQAAEDPVGSNAYLPLEVDTEYYHPRLDLNKASPEQLSPTLTVQCRAIALDQGHIFTHLDSAAYARHPVAVSDFIIVDYLRTLGHHVTLERVSGALEDLPWVQIDLYAFFAVAELLRVFRNEFRDDVLRLTLDAESKGTGIVQGRRLRTFTKMCGDYLPWVLMPWVLGLNGRQYAVRIAWYDTCAVHGQTGYAGLCSNTGTPIPYKDVFTSSEKGDMLRMYRERPEDFDAYALGDLYNHQALVNNIGLFRTIYQSVELDNFFRHPRLTTGATVRDLVEGVIGKAFETVHPEVKPREMVNAYCKHGTSSELKDRKTTGVYNAKVDGGRCRNNRPTHTIGRGVICDLDIAGCYGEGLRVQLYPLGVPIVLDYPLDAPENAYMTLRQFIKRYGKELVPGVWQARVSTADGYRLKYPQDFLQSWFPPKDLRKLATDNELSETDEWWSDDNVGITKVFTHQVNLALVNHDAIQWLDHVASPRQRKELYDKLLVVAAMYYPASERIESDVNAHNGQGDAHKGQGDAHNSRGNAHKVQENVDRSQEDAHRSQNHAHEDEGNVCYTKVYNAHGSETDAHTRRSREYNPYKLLKDAHERFQGRNTCTIKKVKGKTTKISVSQQCHKWVGVTLGEMYITELLRQRKQHPKKTPLNELFKLCINTTFGDMVSPYFTVGNVVVGNNITARARSLAWYMEKGLNGWQTITDGCAFDVNRVLHSGTVRVNGETVVGLYRIDSKNNNLVLKSLGLHDQVAIDLDDDDRPTLIFSNKCESTEGSCFASDSDCPDVSDDCVELLSHKASLDWVNRVAMEHLQTLFPNVDVLNAPTTTVDGSERLGQFSFEAKGLYDGAVFHGTGNYLFTLAGETVVTKMRSYSKRPQEIVRAGELTSDGMRTNMTIGGEDFYPAEHFLTGLINNPFRLQRQPVFLKPSILKVGDFSRHYAHRYEGSKVFPGSTVKQASLIREYSVTLYSYRDLDQYNAWLRESNELRKRYGQSYEMYFLNTDGTLNYQLMVESLDQMVSDGKMGFWDGVERRSTNTYRAQRKHPGLEILETTRERLTAYYGYRTAYNACDSEDAPDIPFDDSSSS